MTFIDQMTQYKDSKCVITVTYLTGDSTLLIVFSVLNIGFFTISNLNSSVGAMCRGEPVELFLIPTSAPCLV